MKKDNKAIYAKINDDRIELIQDFFATAIVMKSKQCHLEPRSKINNVWRYDRALSVAEFDVPGRENISGKKKAKAW